MTTMDKHSVSQMAFHASLGGRTLVALFAAMFVVGPLILATLLVGLGQARPMSSTDLLFLGLYECVAGIPFGLVCYYASGPCDLFIDLDRRTYRQTRGWPHSPTIESGSLDEDLAGVTVHCRQMNSIYQVRLLWKPTRGPKPNWWFHLGTFNRSGQADRFAAEQAAILKLPFIEASAVVLQ